jgi:hypothetical protein
MIADREGDMYDIFEEASEACEPKAQWLIRAKHNRALVDNDSRRKGECRTYLFDKALQTDPRGEIEFELPIRGKCKRKVVLTLYAAQETIRPPGRKHERHLKPQTVSVVIARELNPPAEEEAIEWKLISSLPVESFEQVVQLMNYYLCRWQIEVFFRILKSGCKVEKLQLEESRHLLSCLSFYLIIAWRVLFLTMCGRNYPDLPCDAVFDDEEWKAAFITATRTLPPKKPPSLKDMLVLIATFGGYLARGNDPAPGPTALWIGLQRTRDFAFAIRAVRLADQPP